MELTSADVIVVGSGLAGLSCALALAPRRVTLVTKTVSLAGGSSLWAKGGIAAAIGPGDTPAMHAADTLSAGAGLSDPEGALRLAEEGLDSLRWLDREGVTFDRESDGSLALAQEAAHRRPRIVHAGGDGTGRILVMSLIERVAATASITVLDNTLAHDLIVTEGQIRGLITFNPANGWVAHQSSQVVLATGGIGMTWWHTTNPREATGDGLAMAARAGASLADLEFVQFHPTALVADSEKKGASLPLLTEALRGAGALLIDQSGHRFMPGEHAAAELAPRDVVARAIEKRTAKGQRIYLDLRPVLAAGLGASFPQAIEASQAAGFRPETEPLPVVPAAHYHMGGIRTDDRGRTSIDGLWACGEVATTGIHGANRLASNSLLEALVFARRVAADIANNSDLGNRFPLSQLACPNAPENDICGQLEAMIQKIRILMSQNVGVLRTGSGLEKAYSELSELDREIGDLTDSSSLSDLPSSENIVRWSETRNLVLIARLVTLAALLREESRGAHYRHDYPVSKHEWQRQQTMTVENLGNL